MSKAAVVFIANTDQVEEIRCVNAIAELDEAGNPVAAEVLGLKGQIGDAVTDLLMSALSSCCVRYSYDDSLDVLTISFGTAPRSFGQASAILCIDLFNTWIECVTIITV